MNIVARPRQAYQDYRRPIAAEGTASRHDGVEARVAKLEVEVEHIRRDVDDLRADVKEVRRDMHGVRTTDFRLIFGAIIAVALSLASLMAKGFGWI